MADNTTVNPGAGGDTFAADDIGGVKYPRSKITLGADGTNDGDVHAGNPLPVTIITPAVVPISVASLPLPAGAATAGNQATAISLLSAWNETGRAAVNPVAGQIGVQAGSGVVTANTQRVAIATDANLVAVNSLPLPAGAATDANQATIIGLVDEIEESLATIENWSETGRAAVNLIPGQAGVQGGSGATTVTTQRVAIATDANAVSVASLPLLTASASLTNVSASVTSVALASSGSRKGLLIYNDSTSNLFLKYGTAASSTSFTVKIPPDGYWEMPSPIYQGDVAGIWLAANGAARVTELT